jgi:hypothetical protein
VNSPPLRPTRQPTEKSLSPFDVSLFSSAIHVDLN